jgi:3'-5' exoribonuclease
MSDPFATVSEEDDIGRRRAMKQDYVNELAEGVRVASPFGLRSKELRTSRAGEHYLALELADRTGQVSAVCFRPSAEASAVPVGAVVLVTGRVTTYRGTKRIVVDSLRPAETFAAEDLIASACRSRDELMAEFKHLVAGVSNAELRRVLRAVFGDKAFLARFGSCPGSQSYHHAYLGGLLEHTVAVASLCRAIAGQYPGIDGDLLVCAALLHDIGKCDELSCDTSIEYTDSGRLVGHVVLGIQRVRECLQRARARVSQQRMMLLEHAILSHHGELEWGSPKRPSTAEALLLHHADNLDAKAAGFTALLGSAGRVDESWTDAGNLFRRPLWAPRPAEDDRPSAVVEDLALGQRSA